MYDFVIQFLCLKHLGKFILVPIKKRIETGSYLKRNKGKYLFALKIFVKEYIFYCRLYIIHYDNDFYTLNI